MCMRHRQHNFSVYLAEIAQTLCLPFLLSLISTVLLLSMHGACSTISLLGVWDLPDEFYMADVQTLSHV